MSWYTSLLAALAADTALKALVSTRIYSGPLPPGATLPAVTVTTPSEDTEISMSRAKKAVHTVVYVHAWAETESACRDVAKAAKTVMLAFTTGTHGLYNIHGIGLYEADTEIRHIVQAGTYLTEADA